MINYNAILKKSFLTIPYYQTQKNIMDFFFVKLNIMCMYFTALILQD